MGKKDLTEKEIFIKNRKHIFTLENKISNQELTIDEIDGIIPGYLHINRLPDMAMTYMSPNGNNMFQLTNDQLLESYAELTEVHVDMDFIIKTCFASLIKFAELGDSKNTFSFFEKIRYSSKHNFELYATDIKMLEGKQELICITNPVSKLNYSVNKLKGVLEENKFFDDNFQKFMSLTKQEKHILKLIATGHHNKSISEQLYISNNTVKTHRKHINKKLEAKHLSDVIKYANAFRLI